MVLPRWQHVRLLYTNTLEGEAMSEITTDDKNELIAIFDGWEKSTRGEFIKDGYIRYTWEMDYHSDWSRLMPVVERIEKISDLIVNKVWISINGNSCAIWTYFDVRDILRANMPNDTFKIKQVSKSKLEATYEAIFQFIQWYQKQKEQP